MDVVSFGEILWDIYENPRTRGKGEPIGTELHRMLGGAPANLAVVLARMGKKSAVIGGVGRDAFGDALIAHLGREKVDTRFVLRYPARTGLTFITRDDRGEPSFLFYRDRTADMAPRAKDITPAMGKTKWVVFGSSTMMDPGLAGATTKLLQTARKSGAHVAVDLNVRAHLWKSASKMRSAIAGLVAEADLVKASVADLAQVGGLRWLQSKAPNATLLLTGGALSARAIGAHGDVEARTRAAKCVDATGAGDAFLAGALCVLLEHRAVPGTRAWKSPGVFVSALTVGHLLGHKAVTAMGATTGLVDLREAKRLLGR
jgi:fructokinase